MFLTLADLRSQATAASFSRGQAYYEEGAVGQVRHRPDDNLFSASVSGSADYTVELTLTPEGPDFWCDCPYDYEGICKHSVALGLAVLDKFGPEAQAKKAARKAPKRPADHQSPAPPTNSGGAEVRETPAPPPLVVAAAELEAALRDISKPEKLKFLEQHLRQNPALAHEFISHFYGAPLPPDPLDADPALPALTALRDTLRRALGSLRFDFQHLADESGQLPQLLFVYGQKSRFLPALAERIGAVLEPVLLPAAAAIRAALAGGRLAEAVRRWHGAWLGIMGVKRPAADAYYLFAGGHYAQEAATAWLRLLPEAGVADLLSQQEFAPQEVARCLPVLIRPVLEAARPTPRRPGQAGLSPAVPDAGQTLLLAVALNPSVAPALRAALHGYEHLLQPVLLMRLAAGCRDWPAWEALAVREAAQSVDVALSLLHFYLDHDRRADLLRTAETHFARYGQVVGAFVLAHVLPAEHRHLYVRALTQRLEAAQDFADFEELAGLWTAAERADFVRRVLEKGTGRFTPLFRARVLAAENRPAEILPLALQLDWHPRPRPYYLPPTPHDAPAILPELLLLAARHDPEATLDAVMERTEHHLDDKPSRPVELYERIGSWLRVLHQLPALTEQVTLFAEGLYAKYNKLAHLRRVLREAQVLPEPEVRPAAARGPVAHSSRPGRKPRNPFGR